jgi:hypothetical protein
MGNIYKQGIVNKHYSNHLQTIHYTTLEHSKFDLLKHNQIIIESPQTTILDTKMNNIIKSYMKML